MNVYMAIRGSDHRQVMICFNPISREEKGSGAGVSLTMGGEICVEHSKSFTISKHDFRLLNSVKRKNYSWHDTNIPPKNIPISGKDMDSILGLRNEGNTISLLNCEKGTSVSCNIGIVIVVIDGMMKILGFRSFFFPSDLGDEWRFYCGGFVLHLPRYQVPGINPMDIMSIIPSVTPDLTQKVKGGRVRKNNKKTTKTRTNRATKVLDTGNEIQILDHGIMIRIFTNNKNIKYFAPVYLANLELSLGMFVVYEKNYCPSFDFDEKVPIIFSWVDKHYQTLDPSVFTEITDYSSLDFIREISASQVNILSQYMTLRGIL